MYGPCLSSIGGGQPLSSPSRHSLGRPLPYQQADSPQATPLAINLYPAFALHSISSYGLASLATCPSVALYEIQSESGDHRELSNLSTGYARLEGVYLRVPTSSAMGLNPFDLHALSTPPAFTLS